MKLNRILCEDANGRKFSLLTKDEVTQEWIDKQNVNRAYPTVNRPAIVKWAVEK